MTHATVTLKKRYLKLPVNTDMQRKNVAFYENGVLIYDFDAHLDTVSPQFFTYMDLSHLIGKTVSIVTDPNIDINFSFVDEIPQEGVYQEPYRPLVHFSTKIGWINDPNGLVYQNDEYHLFYQHNPAGNVWGNMTWGHAISRDLVHWVEQSDALFPDKLGTMFSGSAVTDTDNVAGFQKDNTRPMLLFYTAAGGNSKLSQGQSFTQCLAYSLDNGKTFTKYENNPVIPHIEGGNRDPKVVYAEELDCYLLALYLDGDRYTLFQSNDLRHFTQLQTFSLPGDDECPDLYPLLADHNETDRKWVFVGASDVYLVGDMTAEGFIPCQKALPYFYGHRTSYAAQTFSGTKNRRIKIAWEILHAPNQIFENQMGIPCEVTLTKQNGIYRLCTLPVDEFKTLRQAETKYTVNSAKVSATLNKNAYDISITLSRTSPDCTLSLFGHTFHIFQARNEFSYDNVTTPLSYTDRPITLRLIVDTLGVEIFLDGGLIYTVKAGITDYSIKELTLQSHDDTALSGTLTVYELHSIH